MQNPKEVDILVKAGKLWNGYAGNNNAGIPKVEYLDNLVSMTDDKLFEETKNMIWLSAYANNNPRSDYHWQCDATYDEWKRRKGNTDMYGKAHTEVSLNV